MASHVARTLAGFLAALEETEPNKIAASACGFFVDEWGMTSAAAVLIIVLHANQSIE
jgi:hypothetical protein